MKNIVDFVCLTGMFLLLVEIVGARAFGKQKRCEYNGKRFVIGETVEATLDKTRDLCYRYYCGKDGSTLEKKSITCQPMTLPSTYPPTTRRPGCFMDGQYFEPGSSISSGQFGNWCFGYYCDSDGNILTWDDFSCGKTTPEPTTLRPTIDRMSSEKIPGCYYNKNFYPPGTDISSGEDREANWCYGVICSDESQIQYWDNFACFPTTPSPTTPLTSPMTSPPTSSMTPTESDSKEASGSNIGWLGLLNFLKIIHKFN